MKPWLGVGVAVAAAVVAATGAFGGSGATGATKPTLAVVVVGSGPRHEQTRGNLLSREVLSDVRGGLALASHPEGEDRVAVSPVGRQLHR